MRKIIVLVVCIFMLLLTVSAMAFESITAAKAYQMAMEEGAKLIDVRTLEEYYFIGTCADQPNGNPIAYNIPWKIWEDYAIKQADGYYKPALTTVSELFKYYITYLFPDKDTILIVFCRSGHRSSAAAAYLEEELGYTNVYEIDNYLTEAIDPPGGRGGFQGSSANSREQFAGYRGYPKRIKGKPVYGKVPLEVLIKAWEPKTEEDSVAWMDIGLPLTQKLDPTLIYLYMIE